MKKSHWEMSKKYNFFTIFLQTKFQAKILVPKTKRNNDENKHNFAKEIINSYRFCGIVELKE
jgi:hypothetical protein